MKLWKIVHEICRAENDADYGWVLAQDEQRAVHLARAAGASPDVTVVPILNPYWPEQEDVERPRRRG